MLGEIASMVSPMRDGMRNLLDQPFISIMARCSIGRNKPMLQGKFAGDVHMPIPRSQQHSDWEWKQVISHLA